MRCHLKNYAVLCRLALPIFLFVACLLFLFLFLCRAAPHPLLVHRLDSLTRENEKLHRDIRALSRQLQRTELEKGNLAGSRNPASFYSETLGQNVLRLGAIERRRNGSTVPDSHDVDSGTEDDCEIVHIAMVVAGYDTARSVITLVKSILFYRLNPLHFHFVTDPSANHVLSTIFKTWQLPDVNVSFYAIEAASDTVSWIPNSHYSGIYGLMKLTLVQLLPTNLDRVIALDTDLMMMENIGSLWKIFKEIKRRGKLLGVVENQSNWYLGNLWEKQKNPWPAIGRGFNTGVMLLNLKMMKEREWVCMCVSMLVSSQCKMVWWILTTSQSVLFNACTHHLHRNIIITM